MDYSKLTKTVQEIHMPEEMQQRIANQVKHRQKRITVRRLHPGLAAAVIALLLCIPLSVTAVGKNGIFLDVKNWYGAVTGNIYVNATEEIEVSAIPTEGWLLVTVTLNKAEERPFRYFEELAIGRYRILNSSGKVIAKEEATQSAKIHNGQVTIFVPISELEAGTYQLEILSFMGLKEAESDLPIYGQWTWEFTTEP